MSNIIMNIDRTYKETNKHFLELIQSLPRAIQNKIKTIPKPYSEATENKV